MVDKGLLHRMQHAVFGQAFDCRDLRAVLHDRERQAGIDPATIDQNRAGAALAVVATFLGPGQAKRESAARQEASSTVRGSAFSPRH